MSVIWAYTYAQKGNNVSECSIGNVGFRGLQGRYIRDLVWCAGIRKNLTSSKEVDMAFEMSVEALAQEVMRVMANPRATIASIRTEYLKVQRYLITMRPNEPKYSEVTRLLQILSQRLAELARMERKKRKTKKHH